LPLRNWRTARKRPLSFRTRSIHRTVTLPPSIVHSPPRA
jgi:hypothetical protein